VKSYLILKIYHKRAIVKEIFNEAATFQALVAQKSYVAELTLSERSESKGFILKKYGINTVFT